MVKSMKSNSCLILLMAVLIATAMSPMYLSTSKVSADATCYDYEWWQGLSGQCVKDIQVLANHKLPYIPDRTTIAEDGAYGPQTKAGIIRIQQAGGLTQDGIVGPNTWGALCYDWTSRPYAGGPFSPAEVAAATNAGCPNY